MGLDQLAIHNSPKNQQSSTEEIQTFLRAPHRVLLCIPTFLHYPQAFRNIIHPPRKENSKLTVKLILKQTLNLTDQKGSQCQENHRRIS